MQKGTTQTITATIKPTNATNKNVSWLSGNTSTATVTGSGLTATITAVAAGSANITVTTQDGGKTATCNVTVLETGEISQVGNTTWDSNTHTASITIKTTAVGYTFEYQKNSSTGTWTTISGSQTTITGLSNGDTIYARIRYGSEITNASFDIQDREVPEQATISINTNSNSIAEQIIAAQSDTMLSKETNTQIKTESATATITHIDNESGVDIVNSKWECNKSSDEIGIEASSYTNTFSSNNEEINLNLTEGGTYYLHVLTVDKAGNKQEKVSEAIEIEELWIPSKYKVASDSATNIDGGVVITDASSNGNEWVWVPVPDASVMYTAEETALTTETSVKTPYYSKSEIISGQTRVKPGDTSSYREPDLVTGSAGTSHDYSNYSAAGFSSLNDMATKIVANYKQMIESIAKYKGFYIGRYELTANGTKAGAPLTNTDWYTLYANCKSLSASEAAVTRMIWGCQWDVTCNWLADNGYSITDSSSWGNYNDSTGNAAVDGYGSKQNTGYSEYWKANNIYDFAGNCYEWTQEGVNMGFRVGRGGYYYSSGSDRPASYRYSDVPTRSNFSGLSSRPTLIVTP